MKYIINGKEYIINTVTKNPHGYLRELLVEAQLNGWKVEVVKG